MSDLTAADLDELERLTNEAVGKWYVSHGAEAELRWAQNYGKRIVDAIPVLLAEVRAARAFMRYVSRDQTLTDDDIAAGQRIAKEHGCLAAAPGAQETENTR